MISSGTFPEIARWWRRKQQSCGRASSPRSLEEDGDGDDEKSDVQQQLKRPISNNPRTLLLSVARSQDGLTFMRGRVRSLRKQLREDDDPQSRFLLALYLEKLGEDCLEEAMMEMDNALARLVPRSSSSSSSGSSGVNGWALSERSRLGKSLNSLRVRQDALTKARESGTATSSSPAVQGESSEVGGAVKGDCCGGASSATGGDRKRPRPAEDPRVQSGGGNGEWQPLPLPPSSSPLGSCSARFEAIDERPASALSYDEFIETYALPGRPVVLKGGVGLCFEDGCPWDRETLINEAGDKVVPVRRWVPDSVSWARLDDAGRVPLERILGPPPPPSPTTASASAPASATPQSHGGVSDKGIEHQAAQSGDHGDGQEREPLYLHDWSVPQNLGSDCSLLAGRFQVPKFFAGDMLQRLAGQGLPYTDSWPSLFVGPKGSKSDTHVDSFGSHFWMALLEGKKRWILYPKEEAPLLYPVWPEGCHDPVFEADSNRPDAVRTPAALLAKGSCCVLEAGDLLFVPAGCPHRVENLTDTLALSCNYVDATNVDGSLKALQDQAFTDPGAGALASALRACDRQLVRGQSEVPWMGLKKWPREGEVAGWLPQPTGGGPMVSKSVV
ncbi:unnamed protein product [Pylaiella littoralis]